MISNDKTLTSRRSPDDRKLASGTLCSALLFLAAGTAIADSVSRAARKILPAVVQVESGVVDYSSGAAEKT
ncbi:MAG: hypothetical protein QF886_26560, partial [Planctomycetota bacterium]|nr:hypothetical protein [Planctomycetota bacterium]